MIPPASRVDPFDLVVFGGHGDLALRKLLPALYHRERDGQLPDGTRVTAAARRPLDTATYRADVATALRAAVPAAELDAAILERFLGRLDYVRVDAAAAASLAPLGQLLRGAERSRIFYLATAPDLFGAICRAIEAAGLVTPQARVVLEKPLGHDLASSQAINTEVGRIFSEDRVFRIDHYLGKETVQNLMALRFANRIFERLWNANDIDHIQITVAETIGLEGRGGYYDGSGAMRDMVQNRGIL